MTDWSSVLDEMEHHVEAQRAAMAGQAPTPPEFQAPADMGPIPAELRERAQALLRMTLALEGQLSDARDEVVASMQSVGRRKHPSPAAYVDKRA
ncbi:MAG: hypothetical protein ACYCS7_03660 [Acidimicrobiales bacterium]